MVYLWQKRCPQNKTDGSSGSLWHKRHRYTNLGLESCFGVVYSGGCRAPGLTSPASGCGADPNPTGTRWVERRFDGVQVADGFSGEPAEALSNDWHR